MSVNRNKRSVALDLKDPDDLAAALGLSPMPTSSSRTGDPAPRTDSASTPTDLRAEHPALVLCSISGFGQDAGPRSGYDQIVQGASGVMSLTGPVGEPTKWGVPVGDIAAGMFAAYAVAAALYRAARRPGSDAPSTSRCRTASCRC